MRPETYRSSISSSVPDWATPLGVPKRHHKTATIISDSSTIWRLITSCARSLMSGEESVDPCSNFSIVPSASPCWTFHSVRFLRSNCSCGAAGFELGVALRAQSELTLSLRIDLKGLSSKNFSKITYFCQVDRIRSESPSIVLSAQSQLKPPKNASSPVTNGSGSVPP